MGILVCFAAGLLAGSGIGSLMYGDREGYSIFVAVLCIVMSIPLFWYGFTVL
jgi:hypothetical protein